MRAFEFNPGEVPDAGSHKYRQVIIDLDAVVMLEEGQSGAFALDSGTAYPAKTLWSVTLSSGSSVSLTKAAFDRILLAWKSN